MSTFNLIHINTEKYAFAFSNDIKIKLEEKHIIFNDIYKYKCSDILLLKKKIKKNYKDIKYNGDIFLMESELFKNFLFDIKNFIMRINYTEQLNTCDICQKSFKSRENFFKHLDTQKHLLNYTNNINNDNNTKIINKLVIDIDIMKKSIEELKNKYENKPNFNTFKYEYINHITTNKMINFFNEDKHYMTLLIKEINFNEKHPENKNIIFKDLNTVIIFDGNRWIEKNINIAINELILDKISFVNSLITKHKKTFKEYEFRHLLFESSILDTKNNKTKTFIIDEIKKLLLDNNYSPIKKKVQFN